MISPQPCSQVPDARSADPALALEHLANDLLFESIRCQGRGDYPFYSSGYVRRLQTADQRQLSESEAEHPEPPAPHLAMIWRVVRKAKLTSLEVDLLRVLAGGLELRHAATSLGLQPRRAVRVFNAMIAKLRPHLQQVRSTLDEELGWVLYEEQRRRDRTRETHCKRGQEACRESGLCPHRWYLYEKV